jgi:hypothetical protein
MKWSTVIDSQQLDWKDVLLLLQYHDNVFRSQVFVMSLSVALLAYARAFQRYAVLILCSIFILLTTMYAAYTMIQVMRILRHVPYYSSFNGLYYFISTLLLFLIGVFILLGINWKTLLHEKKIVLDPFNLSLDK